MDEEGRKEALEMSKEELLAREASGRPARVAKRAPRRIRRKQDLNQRAVAIVAQATGESVPEGPILLDSAIVIQWELDPFAAGKSRTRAAEGPLAVTPILEDVIRP